MTVWGAPPLLLDSALAAVLVGAAGIPLALRRGRRTTGRLHDLRLRVAPLRSGRRHYPARLLALPVGVAVALLISGWPGLVCGALAGYAVDRVIRRIEPRGVRAARLRAQADLPFALDLTAAALRSGAPPSVAVLTVGAALGGPLGERLDRVGRALGLGAAPESAWSALHDVPAAHRFAAAAVRGSGSGAALARSLYRLADDLRSARLAELETRAQRAGVLVVLPLGLCFLPAFVAGGLVPVVVSMLGTVLP